MSRRDEMTPSIHDAIRTLRTLKGASRQTFATELRCSINALFNYENDRVPPLLTLARIVEVAAQWMREHGPLPVHVYDAIRTPFLDELSKLGDDLLMVWEQESLGEKRVRAGGGLVFATMYRKSIRGEAKTTEGKLAMEKDRQQWIAAFLFHTVMRGLKEPSSYGTTIKTLDDMKEAAKPLLLELGLMAKEEGDDE
jgi:transcriptional regulator with XRE-family HTH domain